MKSTLSVLLILLFADFASAGLFQSHDKGCGDGCPKSACKPVIARPSCTTIFNHQRRVSAAKCCGEDACGPASCCAPTACLESDCSAPELFCPSESSGCCSKTPCCIEPSCAAAVGCSVDGNCGDGCGSGAACYSDEDCKVIAQLIHQSMTGCYAKIRRRAVHRLGDHFDCVCHPEIMNAFIHALNDSDESVREKAADEIGDQIRRNRVCVGPPVIQALQCALADCDWAVRRQTEQALRLAGYRIVDGVCCSTATQAHPTQTESQLQPPLSPPAIHSQADDGSDIPELILLPEESQLTTQHKTTASLKVLPVSSPVVKKPSSIKGGAVRQQSVSSTDAVIPPPVPALEPADYVLEGANVEGSKPARGLMARLFGKIRK